MRIVAVVVAVWSAVAAAQLGPTMAPFPLQLKRAPAGFTPKQEVALQAEFPRLLRQAGVQVPNSYALDVAFKRMKRQDCDVADACLSALALLSNTLYAVFVSVDYSLDETVTVTGRAVSDDGALVRPPAQVKVANVQAKQFPAEVRTALGRLVDALGLAMLPPTRAATKPPEVVVPTPEVTKAVPDAGVAVSAPAPVDAGLVLPPPPPPPGEEPSSLKTAGTVTAITGGVVAVAGAVMWGVGNGEAAKVLQPNGVAPAGVTAEQVRQLRSAAGLQSVGVAVAVVGVAAAGAGLVMRLLAPEKRMTTTMTVAPMPGGAALLWTGGFP
jgi:hypothetical protein